MEQDKFSISKRLRSFIYAFNGLIILFKEEHNSRIHFIAAAFAITAAIYFRLNVYEWVAITFSIGLVITTEIINTVIEKVTEYMATDKNDKIKKIKDLSAAAVLVSAITALSVGLLIFLPKIKC